MTAQTAEEQETRDRFEAVTRWFAETIVANEIALDPPPPVGKAFLDRVAKWMVELPELGWPTVSEAWIDLAELGYG